MAVLASLIGIDAATGMLGGGIKNAGPKNSSILFLLIFVLPAVFTVGFVVLEVILVKRNLSDLKPLGISSYFEFTTSVYLFAAFGWYTLSWVFKLIFNTSICSSTNQYIDGALFSSACTIFAVTSIFKFWDFITEGFVDAFALKLPIIRRWFGQCWRSFFVKSWDIHFPFPRPIHLASVVLGSSTNLSVQ